MPVSVRAAGEWAPGPVARHQRRQAAVRYGRPVRPVLEGESFERDGDEMTNSGLLVSLEPWGWHVLAFHGEGGAE